MARNTGFPQAQAYQGIQRDLSPSDQAAHPQVKNSPETPASDLKPWALSLPWPLHQLLLRLFAGDGLHFEILVEANMLAASTICLNRADIHHHREGLNFYSHLLLWNFWSFTNLEARPMNPLHSSSNFNPHTYDQPCFVSHSSLQITLLPHWMILKDTQTSCQPIGILFIIYIHFNVPKLGALKQWIPTTVISTDSCFNYP